MKKYEPPIDFEILQAVGLLQRAAVKIENHISECLKSSQFFGELK